MKKVTKIYGAVLILLVMLTNISYSVTYSICGMSSMSKCSCVMNDDNPTTITKELSVKKVSCCSEEVKSISNKADFTKGQEKVNSIEFASIFYVFTNTKILTEYLTPRENQIFYFPKRDIPVQYSRLII